MKIKPLQLITPLTIPLAILAIMAVFSASTPVAHATGPYNCGLRPLTLEETKQAITAGGSGKGLILGTRNPATGMLEISRNGDAVVRNDTDCSVPISVASYKINNPSDADFRNQTLYAKSASTLVLPHSTVTLHVSLPPCNYQADFFYGDNVGSNGDRYVKSPYFLEAGYVVNRANAGGIQCPSVAVPSPIPSTTPAPVVYNPPTYNPPTYNPPIYYPPVYNPPTYYPPTYNPPTYYQPTYTPPPQYYQQPQIVQTSAFQVQPQFVQLPEYVALTEIPYTGLDDYPLSTIYTAAFAFWAIVIGAYLVWRKVRTPQLQ